MSYNRSCTGFTLVELMVTLAVLMIMNSLAVPSFQGYLGNRAVQATAYELLGTLDFARSEAIKRNGEVYVRASAEGWQGGWAVVIDPTISFESCLDNPNTCLRIASPSQVLIDGGSTTIVYQRAGRPRSPVPAFELCDSSASDLVSRRQIAITPTGRSQLSLEGSCSG